MAYIPGTAGDDGLAGTVGDDLIEGFGGNDYIIGTSGNDTVDGGGDTDTLWYGDTPGDLFVDLDTGVVLDGWGGTQTLISIENAVGGAFNNTIFGTAGANWFSPNNTGVDYLDGRDGFDVLFYSDATSG